MGVTSMFLRWEVINDLGLSFGLSDCWNEPMIAFGSANHFNSIARNKTNVKRKVLTLVLTFVLTPYPIIFRK